MSFIVHCAEFSELLSLGDKVHIFDGGNAKMAERVYCTRQSSVDYVEHLSLISLVRYPSLICLSNPPIHLFILPSIRSSICSSIHSSFHLSIHPSNTNTGWFLCYPHKQRHVAISNLPVPPNFTPQKGDAPVFLKNGARDLMTYRGAMGVSVVAMGVTFFAIFQMATGRMKKGR